MELKKYEVPVEKLRWECDPKLFEFECTKDLAPLREFVGQDRAIRAVEFGLNMAKTGYNIYVAGLTGTGKTSMVKTYIERLIHTKEASGEILPVDDWCYVYNFQKPDNPQIVSLSQGKGKELRDDVDNLFDNVKKGLEQAFSSDEYKKQKQAGEKSQEEQIKIFQGLAEEARHEGFALKMTPSGPMVIPIVENRLMQEDEYLALDEKAKEELDAKRAKLIKKIQAGFEAAVEEKRKTIEQLQKADKDISEFTVSRMFDPLFDKYNQWPKVKQYLVELKEHVLGNLEIFRGTEEPVNPVLGIPVSQVVGGENPFLPFEVNIFVDNSETKGLPVIIESNPNFRNIFGKLERRYLFGGYVSDHTMLRAGALQRANGGYLLVTAQDVLLNPGVWPALKRAIKNCEVRIEEPHEQFGLVTTEGMRPEPMPIKVKIVLIGDANLYQLLSMYDEDFWEIFKVKAEFDREIEKTKENIVAYAAFLSRCCEENEVRHCDPSGVAKIIEYSARMVADQEKLSSRFAQIKQWLEEASYWASQDGAKFISACHVHKAIDERIFRHNLIDERIQEMITRGVIMIDTDGAVVGQVNGLSVYTLGDITFGKPSRITAKTFLGRGGIVNIERESELSGPIHNKGVLILSGYLGWKYAQDKPLSLSASLCFEQSYDDVDGDSASSTELYAILSSLSGIPIKQNIAVTGSVNQNGVIQPIGGVNNKIEGFFKVCKAKGLTGDQGVLIPHQNQGNLMLREEIVEAVRNGQFHIYSARTIDEGIEVLTGVPMGERQEDGAYPEGTINQLVDKKLREMAEKLKGFYAEEKQKGK
ncbi:MAG: ATP-binding protein [Smithella sp.]